MSLVFFLGRCTWFAHCHSTNQWRKSLRHPLDRILNRYVRVKVHSLDRICISSRCWCVWCWLLVRMVLTVGADGFEIWYAFVLFLGLGIAYIADNLLCQKMFVHVISSRCLFMFGTDCGWVRNMCRCWSCWLYLLTADLNTLVGMLTFLILSVLPSSSSPTIPEFFIDRFRTKTLHR